MSERKERSDVNDGKDNQKDSENTDSDVVDAENFDTGSSANFADSSSSYASESSTDCSPESETSIAAGSTNNNESESVVKKIINSYLNPTEYSLSLDQMECRYQKNSSSMSIKKSSSESAANSSLANGASGSAGITPRSSVSSVDSSADGAGKASTNEVFESPKKKPRRMRCVICNDNLGRTTFTLHFCSCYFGKGQG